MIDRRSKFWRCVRRMFSREEPLDVRQAELERERAFRGATTASRETRIVLEELLQRLDGDSNRRVVPLKKANDKDHD